MKNTIKHIWTVICQKSSVDQSSNILSLFEILEKVDINLDPTSPKIPEDGVFSIPFNYEIVSYWRRTSSQDAKGEARIVIFSPEDIELSSFPVQINIADKLKAYRVIAKINGLKFTTSGEYRIQIQQKVGKDFDIVSEVPFEIEVHKQK